jgi:peroxiredoxin
MDNTPDLSHDSKVEDWVQNKLASLTPPIAWQPRTDAGLTSLRCRLGTRIAWQRPVIYAAAALMITGGFLAFPATRVLAGRCVDACVAGTATVGQLLGIKSRVPVVQPLAPDGNMARNIAPDFELPDQNGQPVNLKSLRGKVVVVNFWATWCGPCKVEIPWFVEFQHKFSQFSVVGVSMDDDGWKSVKPFLEKHGVNYAVVLGEEALTKMYGGVNALPATFIIDKRGRIAAIHTGVVAREIYLEEIIRVSAE